MEAGPNADGHIGSTNEQAELVRLVDYLISIIQNFLDEFANEIEGRHITWGEISDSATLPTNYRDPDEVPKFDLGKCALYTLLTICITDIHTLDRNMSLEQMLLTFQGRRADLVPSLSNTTYSPTIPNDIESTAMGIASATGGVVENPGKS